jgi:hypothetical protein
LFLLYPFGTKFGLFLEPVAKLEFCNYLSFLRYRYPHRQHFGIILPFSGFCINREEAFFAYYLRLFQNFSFWGSYPRFNGKNGCKTFFPRSWHKTNRVLGQLTSRWLLLLYFMIFLPFTMQTVFCSLKQKPLRHALPKGAEGLKPYGWFYSAKSLKH